MLVLTRKSEEKIVIGEEDDPIIIHVLKVADGKVSLGIEARGDIPVYRAELLERNKPKASKLSKIQIDLNNTTDFVESNEKEMEEEVVALKGPAL